MNTCATMTPFVSIGRPGMAIPFFDLRAALTETQAELTAAFGRVLASGNLIFGAETEAFEREFAALCGTAHSVAVGSGLDALTLMLMGLGVGRGDEVIVPGNTYIATWLAVSAVGAHVVPVEPDCATFNIRPAAVEAAVTPRSAAILAVHLYGQSADMTELRRIATKHGLALLVDAAQAAGARIHGEARNIVGDAAGFSFYPTKNLGALGDGGAVATDDAALADKVRMLRNYGSPAKDRFELKGVNSRLGELQAAFLRSRIARLDEWNRRRRALAERYVTRLAGAELLRLPQVIAGAEPVWHLFTVRVGQGRRDELQRGLAAAGIGTGIYYPVPPHLAPAYAAERRSFAPLPLTEALAREILSLPLHPHLTPAKVDRVSDAVLDWLATAT
jgi:dTDP-3-amino-3,4,6-trideoxy-alpha-D-glucose transaminase